MSFPQTQASQEVQEGQDFWRLFTDLDSAGDIYEMNVSAKAFIIGPESDISRVRITYFDPTSPTKSSSFVVGIDDPFSGRIDAMASLAYPNSLPARILIAPEDNINRTLSPTGFDIAEDLLTSIQPKIDLIGYMSPPPFVPAKRSDKRYRGVLPVPAPVGIGDASSWLSIPFYGRKSAVIKIRNVTAADVYAINVTGVTYMANATYAYEYPIVAAGVVGAADSSIFPVRVSVDEPHDKLIIEVEGPANDGLDPNDCLYYDILCSDEVL